jgi:hypothetical protein
MPQKPLDPALMREAQRVLLEYGGNVTHAAVAMGIPRGTLVSRLTRAQASGVQPEYERNADADGPPVSTHFDDRWDTFTKWIGRTRRMTKAPERKSSKRIVIDHYADLHIPHMNEAAFYTALSTNKGSGDRCVIGGDSLNAGAVSRFVEGEISHPRDEFAMLTLVLQAVAEQYADVDVNMGNHVERFKKYFAARLPHYVMFLCQLNPIQFVVDGLRREHGITNIRVAKPIIEGLDSSNWMTVIGDCVFAHGESHSKIHMRPVENVARWLRRWRRHIPVDPRVVINEHNHRGGMVYDEEAGALLIQAPCFSNNVAYQAGPDLKYGPNQVGYVRVVQDSGRTLVNETRFYLLDEDGKERVA